MNEQQLRQTVVGSELGDNVGASRASFSKVGEDLLVEKLDLPKIETLLDVREEELQKLLQERLQKFLESWSCPIQFVPRTYKRETNTETSRLGSFSTR